MAAGYRSYTSTWSGGAGAAPPPAGYGSLLAFWIGGAAGFVADVTPPVGGGIYRIPRKVERQQRKQFNVIGSPATASVVAGRTRATVTRYADAVATYATLSAFTGDATKVLKADALAASVAVHLFDNFDARIDRFTDSIAAYATLEAGVSQAQAVRFASGISAAVEGVTREAKVTWYRVPVLVNRRLAKVTPSQMPIAIPVKLATRIDPMLAELMNADV